MANPQLEDGYFCLPNGHAESAAAFAGCGLAELNVALLLSRETAGFGRVSAELAVSYVHSKLGLDDRNIKRTLRRLEEKRVVRLAQPARGSRAAEWELLWAEGPGYTRLADELFDAVLRADVRGQLKRLMVAVLRSTYGIQGRKSAPLAVSYLAQLTKIHQRDVEKSMRLLTDLNVLVCTRRTGGYQASEWRLNKDFDRWLIGWLGVKSPGVQEAVSDHPGEGVISPGVLGVISPGVLGVISPGQGRHLEKHLEKHPPSLPVPDCPEPELEAEVLKARAPDGATRAGWLVTCKISQTGYANAPTNGSEGKNDKVLPLEARSEEDLRSADAGPCRSAAVELAARAQRVMASLGWKLLDTQAGLDFCHDVAGLVDQHGLDLARSAVRVALLLTSWEARNPFNPENPIKLPGHVVHFRFGQAVARVLAWQSKLVAAVERYGWEGAVLRGLVRSCVYEPDPGRGWVRPRELETDPQLERTELADPPLERTELGRYLVTVQAPAVATAFEAPTATCPWDGWTADKLRALKVAAIAHAGDDVPRDWRRRDPDDLPTDHPALRLAMEALCADGWEEDPTEPAGARSVVVGRSATGEWAGIRRQPAAVVRAS